MKRHIDRNHKHTFLRRIAGVISLAVLFVIRIQAAPAEKYTATSVLAGGNWVKIDIKTPGLQTLTRQTLKNFGFSDPRSVYVYGYGGRMLSEVLSPSMPDDLPAIPVIRKEDGSLTFYAVGNLGINTPSVASGMSFDHTINPYGDTSYYFLSDVAPDKETIFEDLSDIDGLTKTTSFIRQIVHERDLLQCAESGRDYLGEDFKSEKSQTFDFDLPDNVNGTAKIRVKFGANTSGASSSFIVSANGVRLPSTNSDQIAAVTASDQYYRTATSVKTAENVGNSLSVGIEYSQAGVVNTARLDWIEVEYERQLALKNSELYFHVNSRNPTAYEISGATPQTIIWDVTEPWAVKEVKGVYDEASKTITIGIHENGIHEFIAFEPTVKGASISGRIKVANQNLHGLPTPDMVIITPDEFAPAAERIARLHRVYDGMTVHVLSPEKIYNEFSSGNADVSAFRKLLKMWYDRSIDNPDGTKFGYCLLMGRPTYDHKLRNPETIRHRYPHMPIWQSQTGLTETTSYCTDDFISMLEDEYSIRSMVQRKQLIGVGRYTVTSAEEADIVADKLEAYISNPEYGVWRNNVMVIADDGDNAQHLTQAQKSIDRMQQYGAGPHYAYERLYLDAFERKQTGSGLTFPDAKERMLMKWQKEGVSLINYIGHANPKEWGHEKLLTWNDINTMSNQRLPIVYAATCSFGKWDAEEISGAELMLSNPAGGVIAIITPSRTVYISRNEYITNSISNEFLRRNIDGKGQRLGDILRLGKNNCESPDDNMLRYHLFGDPALRMPVPQYNVVVESIADMPVAENQSDSPTVMANSTLSISGRVIDEDGNTVPFNGPLQYTLFDAERSIVTNGWGDAGKEMLYQDRSSKLATGSTMVTDGIWSATVLMPSEISNNYSPAFITLYAYDPTIKTEANGSTDRLFVYGYDTNAPEDTEGPMIEGFGINSLHSGDGNTVHPNPVAMAVFSDERGINISDATIGHKMNLMLDSDKVYDDISHYFVPDPEDPTKGSIAYPLENIEPGEHTLTLTVWDNANNSSQASINFNVGLNMRPQLAEITSLYNRDTDQIQLKVTTDRAMSKLNCRFECFDLGGCLMWSVERNVYSGKDSSLTYVWDLKDSNGHRIPRGIYLLRTHVSSEDNLTSSESKKIAIPAK